MIDVIKEYLVSLGMSVDRKSFDDAGRTIETVEKTVKSFAGSTIKGFAVAGAAIVSALASASIGISVFLGSLAKADLENEKFARKMWLSKDAAAELNYTLKAMGATVEDLYLSPELLRNFQQLRSTIREMKPPPEFQDQMKSIRSIQFEFQRLRLEAAYALQWVGFYLYKYLEGPIKGIKGGLQGFNDAIIKGMPQWTKNVAQFFSWIARLGIALMKGGRDVLHFFSKLGDHIPDKLKLIGGALIALGLIIKTGPIGIAFALFTGLLLLLDDFYTYLEGGESAFAPLWKKLLEVYKTLKDTGAIDRWGKAFDKALRTIRDWIKIAGDWLQQLFSKFQERGYLDAFVGAWSSAFDLLYKIVKELWDWVVSFFKDLNDEGILSGLVDSLISLGKEVYSTISWVADLVSAFLEIQQVQDVLEGIGNILSGSLKMALETIKLNIDNVVNAIKLARAWLSDDENGVQEALQERKELTEKAKDRASYYGNKISKGLSYLFVDQNGSNPFLSDEKQSDKLNSSVNNLPKGMEPSFKKAMNESELVKGFRNFNQDLKTGFSYLAAAINPDVFKQFQDMSMAGIPSSYMYSNTATSNQTIIQNENKPVFYITSTDPKGAAQEVGHEWNGMNIRNMKAIYG